MRLKVAYVVVALVLAACMSLASCAAPVPSKQDVRTLTVWTYYNGEQLAAFQSLVSEYNETVGKEAGVSVACSNVGSVNDLRDAVMNSATGKVGADPIPNIFMTYGDTAYAIDQMGMLADLAPYLSEEERDLYVDGYLEEGVLGDSGSIKIFPVAKSTEVFVLNKTDFDEFAADTGVTYDDLATYEGVARVAQLYYEWTDAKTPEPNDGDAFFGIDALANYFYVGASQLGSAIITVEDDAVALDFDKEVVRKLWDNYYVPFVKGYYDARGHYRSDDIKTGTIIALLGSSSGATFFPTHAVSDDGEEHAIEMVVLPCPRFEGGADVAVQQGAGMAVVNTSDEDVEASIAFLEWITEPAQNIQFSTASGYLPVMKSANNIDAVRSSGIEVTDRMEQILEVAITETTEWDLFTPHVFEKGTEFRDVLEHSLSSLATQDAAAVREALAAGTSYEDALAPYLTDRYFEQWYDAVRADLESLL